MDFEEHEVTRLDSVNWRFAEAWCPQPLDCIDVLLM